MFTGIVQEMLPIKTIESKPGLLSFSISFPKTLLEGLETGASVSVNGVCFTVTSIDGADVSFDAIAATQALSNIGEIEVGSNVNIERSAKHGAEVGGHVLSGHVVGAATVVAVKPTENNRQLTIKADQSWMKYVFDKGFLALNGCSLTVTAINKTDNTLAVNLIPETLERTNFSLLEVGDTVNVEIDQQTQVIVETVERVMAERLAATA